MKDITLLELLQSGAHFGHKTARWHPKMKSYIHGVRGGVHILDLEQTKSGLLKAAATISDIAAVGGTILFVGTKRQARKVILEAAERSGMPYVANRWLGGTFTNFRTIQKTIKRLEKLKNQQIGGELAAFTKKERLLVEREILKMEKFFSGILNLKKLPEAIFVADINHDRIAVEEAKRCRVKVVGVLDSNSDPAKVDIAIPANDDAVSSIAFVANFLADAIIEGKNRYGTEPTVPFEPIKEKQVSAVEDVQMSEANAVGFTA